MIDDIRKIISHKIEKAYQTLEDSKFLIENRKYNIAVNRMYYSVFYIISALALKYDYNTSKHGQLLGWFNKNFVAKELIGKEIGRNTLNLFEKRTKADYDDFIVFSDDQVNKMYEDTEKVLNEITKLINKN
ncbi:MAG: HEPN domain-containing protein [Spirochaetes bacterium]|nr:HEPN domain-containing protein [Spirochaetota bacterium]